MSYLYVEFILDIFALDEGYIVQYFNVYCDGCFVHYGCFLDELLA